MLAAGICAIGATWFTTYWLLESSNEAETATDRAKVRIEAVRTGLAAGAGAGAAVGLMLAFHRQRHQEIATALGDHDATERRVTELYNSAADQLGSDKAPVRLTALYTLERLANDNPRHRQTIVNIVCAYLRMPWSPPSNDADRQYVEQVRKHVIRYRSARLGQSQPTEATAHSGPDPDPDEEIQVRQTAQLILASHLARDSGHSRPPFWEDIDINLEGALLIDFPFNYCSMRRAEFSGAIFGGVAGNFLGAIFNHQAHFEGATFEWASFHDAAFHGGVRFSGMKCEFAEFSNTKFTSFVEFTGMEIQRRATFTGAEFEDERVILSDHGPWPKVANRDLEHTLPLGWWIEPSEGTEGLLRNDSQSEA
ncbi:pentapeptide repeat-containing protein [Actinomadura sp. 6N118]|uniref:pentapeptide repeat-containing protein n=1 Tax=Actinomadura sp. 6N118 TaxID=3375151 RepID=UPI003797CFE5